MGVRKKISDEEKAEKITAVIRRFPILEDQLVGRFQMEGFRCFTLELRPIPAGTYFAERSKSLSTRKVSWGLSLYCEDGEARGSIVSQAHVRAGKAEASHMLVGRAMDMDMYTMDTGSLYQQSTAMGEILKRWPKLGKIVIVDAKFNV